MWPSKNKSLLIVRISKKLGQTNGFYFNLATSCDTRASHASPILFIHFQSAFSKPMFSPSVPCNHGTCVHVCHSSFAFLLVLEFTPFFTFPLDTRFNSTCSNLFTPVHTCSQLFTTVHNCSHLFTPQWLFTLFAEWEFLVEFSSCESCYFSILGPILLKLQIVAHLIESFKTVYGLCSCIKIEMSIPLASFT